MIVASITSFGDPETAFSITEQPDPVPGRGEVIIRTRSIGVGGVDILMRRGELGTANPHPPFIPGLEAAGEIYAIGDGVGDLHVGQRVVGILPATGAYTTHMIALAEHVTVLPETISFDDAASVVNFTAATVLIDTLPSLNARSRVLVHAAAQGFGAAFATVLSIKYPGISITGTYRHTLPDTDTSVASLEWIASKDLPAAMTYDYVFDPVGGELRRHSLKTLLPFGTLLAVGNAEQDDENTSLIDTTPLWLGGRTVQGFNLGLYATVFPDSIRAALADVLTMMSNRLLKPAPARSFRLEDAQLAHQAYETKRGSRFILKPE